MACFDFNISYRYREKVEEILSCVFCQKQLLCLMVLPCSHRVCEDCVSEERCECCPVCMQDSGDTKPPLRSSDQQFIEDYFFCEVVREEVLKDMLKSVQSGQTVESKCESCNEVSVKVTAYCQQCGGIICEYCLDAHSKIKAIKHHNSTLLSDIACGNATVNTVSKSPTCPNHPLMEITYYCIDCNVLVCVVGSHVHHRKHDVKFMGDLRHGILEKFKEVRGVTVRWKKEYEQLAQEAGRLPATLDRELSHAIERVHEMAVRKSAANRANSPDKSSDDVITTFSEGVRMEEKSLVLEVKGRKKVLINRISRVQAYIQRTLQQIVEANKFAEFLTSQTSHWSIFTVVPQMNELFTSLNEELIGGTPGLKSYSKMNFDFEEINDESTISFARIVPLKFWGLRRGWNIKKISSKAWILKGLETLSCGQLLVTGSRGSESLIGRFDPMQGNFDFNTNTYGSKINSTAVVVRPHAGDELGLHRREDVAMGMGQKVLITSYRGDDVKGEFECWSERMNISCISVNNDTQDIVVGNDRNSHVRVFDSNHQLKQYVAPRQFNKAPCSVAVSGDRILICDSEGARAVNLEGECIARYLPTNESKGYINRAKVIRNGSHGKVFVLWECETESGCISKYFVMYNVGGKILSEREVRENMCLMAVLPNNEGEPDLVAVCSSRGWLGIYMHDFLQ